MTQVALPWMPIFSSSPAHLKALRWPGAPEASGRNLGVMNSDRPRVPAGAPSVRASTSWTVLGVKSCSPPDIQIFSPLILHEPSSALTALVRISPRSVPHCGSVRFMAPDHSPVARRFR